MARVFFFFSLQQDGSGDMECVVDRLLGVLDNFFGISQRLLRLPGNLLIQALCLLLLVANQFTGFLLNLAYDVFDSALDLIFIHDDSFQIIINK